MLDKSIPHIGILMTKTDTKNYPRFELPIGFAFCGYKAGYEKEWADLMFELGQTDTLKQAQEVFENEFLSKPELLQKQCLFVLDKSGEVAACGSLWHGEHFGKQLWRIHWIATKPNYQGKGLIKALLTKLLDIYNELGFDGFVYLTSQTWSYKAINLYSKFGFMPYKGEKPQNWKTENYDSENNKAWQIIDSKIAEYKIKQISDSIAPCGLVCKLCHFADSCGGCKSETNCCGSRKSDEGCYQYNCCEEKGFDGCWQCEIAPCDKGMFSESHDIRLRAFITYIKRNGKDKLADRLYHNAQNGVHYGHGKDYDNLDSINAVIERIEG